MDDAGVVTPILEEYEGQGASRPLERRRPKS